MATGAVSSITVKDYAATTKTFSKMTDPNNSSYLVPKVVEDDALRIKATFSTGANLFTLPAVPTDVIQIKGSATKTVRIKRIIISGQATTAKQWPLQIIRRVAAVTDGTPVTPVVAAFDASNDGSSTGVVTHYTALPTPAAANPASSVLFARDMTLTAPATASQPIEFNFCRNGEKGLVLRGAADCIVANLGGGALTAGEKLSYEVVWEEDAS
jgi:hypothetical protein